MIKSQGLNRDAENMRNLFPIVNDLISNVKKVFLKASLKIQFYEEQLSNVALPPEPIIITRLGARLETAIFCALCTSFFVPYTSTKEKKLKNTIDFGIKLWKIT
jgi:hypothetical protein